MQIHSIQSFPGRNIYSHKPVVKMILDLDELHDVESKDIEGFNSKILNAFPGLGKHHCSLGYEGGFADRLKEGTYFGHIIEHIILELQNMTGYEVNFGKTRLLEAPSIYMVIYEFINERCGMECGRTAVDIVSKLVSGRNVDINSIKTDIRRISIENDLGPSTQTVFEEARRRGIPVSRLGDESLLQLGYGKYSRFVEASLTDTTTCITADIAGNKHLTKRLLMDSNIPVPNGDIAYTEYSAVALAREIGYPVVVKPLDCNQGKGVTLGINSEEQIRIAYREALRYSKTVIVEKYIKGRDYRILVVGGKVTAVSERKPPFVVGDGIRTISELIEQENRNPLRGDDHERPLTRIRLDGVVRDYLLKNGMDEKYIPAGGEAVYLRGNGNLSTGGTARDCTELIHPANSAIAVKAAKIIGLDIAGVDMTTEDISTSITGTGGAVIEINAAPGLRMHVYPSEGKSRNVAADILDMIFPSDRPCSIPIVSITGTNGKTTTTRLIAHTLGLSGMKVGMTTTSGVYIGNECVLKGDNTGCMSARMVLSNREIDAAVLETARGGIVRRGLGYDMADVGVITNISDDHLGLDGINSLEELAYVKALVIEAVRPDGNAVLNADDPMTGYLLKRAVSEVILFSKDPDNPLVQEHIRKGLCVVYVNRGMIYKQKQNLCTPVIAVKDIPITFGGMAECNIENSLAAISSLFGLNMNVDVIKAGLQSFVPDIGTNPGRFNIFDMGNFKVMLDYGHNTAGYSSVIGFIRKLGAERLVGVIGVPGDRLDRNIYEIGKISAKAFSYVIIKEDGDLRGRQPGEVAGILYNAVVGNGMKKDDVRIINSELKALETAILDAKPGDLIVMFYEELEPALEMVTKFKKELEKDTVMMPEMIQENVG